jgi:thiamine pyrophosphokinase
VLIVAAGEGAIPDRWIEGADVVIAADSGLANTRAHSIAADVVVGDMDSVDPGHLADAESAGAVVERHPAGKDESDLELALSAAVERGATHAMVVVRDGGRLDHALANLTVLASPRWADLEVSALVGSSQVWPVHRERSLPLQPGDHLALHAIGGPAIGVTSTGVRFALDHERLDPFVARGIANVVEVAEPTIQLEAGVLLVISSPRGRI